MPIAIDDPFTWPPTITAALQEALPALQSYQKLRVRFDAEREANPDNIMWRINPPINPFRAAREDLAAEIEEQIADLAIMAWHCTRLCPDEIAAVRTDGMFLLSPETFNARVQRRVDAGDITLGVAQRLRGANQAADEHRINQLWFVLTRKPLGTSGVRDLLGYWGGEALYRGHDRDPETGPVLKALGRPCIVELAVPHDAIRSYGRLGLNIIRTFELAHDLHDENSPDCEGHTRLPIVPDHVLRVITTDDDDFTALTRDRDWPAEKNLSMRG